MSAPELAPGVRVRITFGRAEGKTGTIKERFFSRFDGIDPRKWVLQSSEPTDIVRQRIIREDWLEVLP